MIKLHRILFILSMASSIELIYTMESDNVVQRLIKENLCISFQLENLETALIACNATSLGIQLYELLSLSNEGLVFGVNNIREDFQRLECNRKERINVFLLFLPSILSVGSNSVLLMTGCDNSLHLLSNLMVACIGLANTAIVSYDDFLENNRNVFRSIKLIPQKKIRKNLLKNRNCLICLDNLNEDCINLCDMKDHLYCRSCLESWFIKSNENHQNIQDFRFKCELCRKDIPQNNNKVEIVVKNTKPNYKQVASEMMGLNGMFALIFAAAIVYNIKLIMDSYL